MLFILISDNKIFRKEKLGEILKPLEESELISIDDSNTALADLERYLYPSLFSPTAPVVHAQFMLGEELPTGLAKKLVASPTVFIFEELSLPAPIVTVLKKSGAVTHVGEKIKLKKEEGDIFAAVLAITARDKKSRWLAYRTALATHPIEAILGILYWKVRTLAAKESHDGPYKKMYAAFLRAHARAWQTGAPLEALIEKVILTQ